MKIVIIDYGAGNLKSVTNALKQVAPAEAEILSTADAASLRGATHIILPGVGAFADCMRGLQALPGMIAALEKRVLHEGVPFLGICVGMQMLFERGNEHGVHAGLGWLKGEVLPLAPLDKTLKVPHMGWNELILSDGGLDPRYAPLPLRASPGSEGRQALLREISSGDHVYFVHSYHCLAQPQEIIATTTYGGAVTAAVVRDNVMGVQFHPEKSQQTGLQLFRNFLSMAHHGTKS